MTSPDPSDPVFQAPAEWQRLDPRMLLVHPVKEVLRFLPVLLGVFVAGTASGGGAPWWNVLGVGIPVALGVLRYLTTSYRIAQGRVELRRGLLNRHVLSTPLDRVRTVDITAPPVHRLLGLTSVRIGTGAASTDDEEQLDLDGLPAERARQLRAELLRGTTEPASGERPPAPVLRLDPGWARFAPLTGTGLVIAAGVLGAAAQLLDGTGSFERLDTEGVAEDAAAWSLWVALPLGAVLLLVVVSALAIAGYLVTNWGFRLTHTGSDLGGAWHLRRGLVTTRETTLDDERVRGVALSEPIGLRLAGGARAFAIVTGLDRRQTGSSLLVPPAPRGEVERVAGAVLHAVRPVTGDLTPHGPDARRRRYTRALGPAVAIAAAAVLLVLLAGTPAWVLLPATLLLPAAAALAADRTRSLGHGLLDGHVVARSGSIERRREALDVGGVIGWNFRSSWFQRRAGLTTLAATTAGGRQSVTVLDVPEATAIELARAAHPDLLGQFLEASSDR